MPRLNRTNDGRSFQQSIITTLTAYESKNLMRVRKVDPPSRVLGGGKSARRVIFMENPFLDFAGAWTGAGGRAVFFEAKSTSDHKLRFDSDSGLTTKQLNALRSWWNSGAVAFVLWEWRNVGVKLVLAGELAQKRDGARAGEEWKHIVWESVDREVKQGMGTRLVDFLPVLERLYGRQ